MEVAFFFYDFFLYLKLLFTNYDSKIIRVSLNRIALLASDASLISKLYRKFRTLCTKLHGSIPFPVLQIAAICILAQLMAVSNIFHYQKEEMFPRDCRTDVDRNQQLPPFLSSIFYALQITLISPENIMK